MIVSVILFIIGSCRVETSQFICSDHLTGFCMLRVFTISEWTIVYFNSFEQLSEECSAISIYRELFYKNRCLIT